MFKTVTTLFYLLLFTISFILLYYVATESQLQVSKVGSATMSKHLFGKSHFVYSNIPLVLRSLPVFMCMVVLNSLKNQNIPQQKSPIKTQLKLFSRE